MAGYRLVSRRTAVARSVGGRLWQLAALTPPLASDRRPAPADPARRVAAETRRAPQCATPPSAAGVLPLTWGVCGPCCWCLPRPALARRAATVRTAARIGSRPPLGLAYATGCSCRLRHVLVQSARLVGRPADADRSASGPATTWCWSRAPGPATMRRNCSRWRQACPIRGYPLWWPCRWLAAALEDRLRGILDSRRSRATLAKPAVCLVVALAAAAIAPLAMLRAAPPGRQSRQHTRQSPINRPSAILRPRKSRFRRRASASVC